MSKRVELDGREFKTVMETESEVNNTIKEKNKLVSQWNEREEEIKEV